ncbi:MAG: hypothetical protein ACFB10_19510, partial [Salibacteraceae bacterium]
MNKKIALLSAGLLFAAAAFAQNTFPTPTGNAGIGTTSPAASLDVKIPFVPTMESGIRITRPNLFGVMMGSTLPLHYLLHVRKLVVGSTGFEVFFLVNND